MQDSVRYSSVLGNRGYWSYRSISLFSWNFFIEDIKDLILWLRWVKKIGGYVFDFSFITFKEMSKIRVIITRIAKIMTCIIKMNKYI